ncbi:hypothetical protein HPB50_029344 [Hyalomma asiaticum]|nr:hypothetical protein HPB50_029344 [Hyalomma asiaticum]
MAPPTDRDFRNEIRELRAELKELKESVKFMNAEFEEMKKKLVVADHGKSNVVVQFKTRQKRDSVLEKARKKRIRNREVGVADESPIFVNEHLCPALKRLLSLAINKKRERHWRFVWTRNGKIFARRSETSDAIRIECERDLGKID